MQFYESEVNMTTGEKNELKKLQRKKEVRRQYEKIAITVGVIIVIIFAGKMIFGKKKSVPTAVKCGNKPEAEPRLRPQFRKKPQEQ